jgi:hypothetical protein
MQDAAPGTRGELTNSRREPGEEQGGTRPGEGRGKQGEGQESRAGGMANFRDEAAGRNTRSKARV